MPDDLTRDSAAKIDIEAKYPSVVEFYCPGCAKPVDDPLVCGDCASLICRRCGSPLERIDDLGIG